MREMKRLEFKLSMPGNNSWNGKWSGEGRNYTIVRRLTDLAADMLDDKSWSYDFGDGWSALVSARIVPVGERLRKSDGFCGYDWMVTSIICDGGIYSALRPKPGPDTAANPGIFEHWADCRWPKSRCICGFDNPEAIQP